VCPAAGPGAGRASARRSRAWRAVSSSASNRVPEASAPSRRASSSRNTPNALRIASRLSRQISAHSSTGLPATRVAPRNAGPAAPAAGVMLSAPFIASFAGPAMGIAFGLAGVNLHTWTGWGPVTYWNAFVANLEMHGKGTFFDPRLQDPGQFPIAAKAGFDDVRFAASVWLGGLFESTGRTSEGIPILDAVEDLASNIDDRFNQAWWVTIVGQRYNWRGDYDQSLALLERFDSVARKHQFMLVVHQWSQALALGGKGAYQPAIDLLRQVIGVCERVGEPLWRTRSLNLMGWLYGELQDIEQAMAWNTRGVVAAEALAAPDLEIESNARLNLGDNLLALGRLDEAEERDSEEL